MVFIATLKNMPAISWRLMLLMDETGVPRTKPYLLQVADIILYRVQVPMSGYRTHNVSGNVTVSISRCISNYHKDHEHEGSSEIKGE